MMAEYDDLGQNLSKKLELGEAKAKIAKYCAYQERAHTEVRDKLYSFGLGTTDVDDILAWLITENYVNEERYANAFAGGKFRVKKWGRIKIRQYLQLKNISEYSINTALSMIDEDDYVTTINGLIDAKLSATNAPNVFELRHKISKSIIAKGFEPELVWERIKEKIV